MNVSYALDEQPDFRAAQNGYVTLNLVRYNPW